MLFKNVGLLEEKPGDESFDLSEVKRIGHKIDWYAKRKDNTIFAYIGTFGAGKTTILRKVKDDRPRKYLWHEFESWRYSDRNKLWDGFAIEIIRKIRQEKSKKQIELAEIAEEIEGERWSKFERWLRSWQAVLALLLVWFVTSVGAWIFFNDDNGAKLFLFIQALLKYSLPTLLALLAVVGFARLLPRAKRPLKRIFDLEDLLLKELKNGLEKPLVVIIEDIDRTGEEGIVFLETLRNFLKKSEFNDLALPIIVVAPQDFKHFDIVNNNGLDGFQRSLKIYDFETYMNIGLWVKSLDVFLNQLGTDEAYKADILMVAESFAGSYSTQCTMRLLKRCLRSTYEFCDAYPGANPALALSLLLSRYIVHDANKHSLADNIKTLGLSYEGSGIVINIFNNFTKNDKKVNHAQVGLRKGLIKRLACLSLAPPIAAALMYVLQLMKSINFSSAKRHGTVAH